MRKIYFLLFILTALFLIFNPANSFAKKITAGYDIKLVNPQRALFSILADFNIPRSYDTLVFQIPKSDNHYTEGYGQHIKKLDLIDLKDSSTLKLTRNSDEKWTATNLKAGKYRLKYLLPIQHIMMMSEYGVDETPFYYDHNGILIGTGMIIYPQLEKSDQPDSIIINFDLPENMIALIPERVLGENSYVINSFEDVQNDYWAVGVYDTLTLGDVDKPLLVAVQDNAFGFTREQLVYDLRCVWNQICSVFGSLPNAKPYIFITRFPMSEKNESVFNAGAASPGTINILFDDKLKAHALDENFGLVAYNLFVQWIPISYYPEDRMGMNWLVQGAANYYQNLLLLRCNIISQKDFLNRVIQTYEFYLSEYERRGISPRAARDIPSAAGYVGAADFLTAMALDLRLRSLMYEPSSLDEFIKAITDRYKDGQTSFQSYHLFELCDTLCGYYPKYFLDSCLNLNTMIDLPGLLSRFGVKLDRSNDGKPDFGAQFASFDNFSIADVRRGGPAYDAGLEIDDIITKVDGKEFKTALDMVKYIDAQKPGKSINIEYTRDKDSRKTKVKLGGQDKFVIIIDKNANKAQKERWLEYIGDDKN